MTFRPNKTIESSNLSASSSRREFIKQATAVGVGAATAATLISPRGALSATPKKGGTLRLASSTGGANDVLDPVKFTVTNDFLRGYQLYSPLVALSNKGGPRPALVLSWEPNAGATEWVFKLRDDVLWSDGKKFTAKDVLYSLNRHLSEKSESPGKPLLKQIAELKADGDHVVRVVLKRPNADFPILFANPRFVITQDGEEAFKQPASIGPYLLTEFTPGIRTVLNRNDAYWDGPANLDTMIISVVVDPTARMNALMAGTVDAADTVDHKLLDVLKASPDVEIVASRSAGHTNLVMMCDRAPTDNADLRMAMKLLIPRRKIVDTVFKGYGMIGNDHQVAPIDPFYCQNIPQRGYDPEKAKFHLKKAGMENLSIELHVSDQATIGAEAIALLCKEAARPAGLDYKIIKVPPGSYWQTAWMKQPVVISAWNARPTADLMLTTVNKSDGSWNETQWKNELFDKLLVEARGTLDIEKRKQMYCEMQRLLHDDGGVGMLAFSDNVDAHRMHVMGFDAFPGGFTRNAFFGAEVWLAD